jgi:hypothetical protein
LRASAAGGGTWRTIRSNSGARLSLGLARSSVAQPFLPLTLELGSWAWVRKNPRQLTAARGWFDPIVPHRVRRTLRRHLPLFDLLQRASAAPHAWSEPDPAARAALERDAFARWYGR